MSDAVSDMFRIALVVIARSKEPFAFWVSTINSDCSNPTLYLKYFRSSCKRFSSLLASRKASSLNSASCMARALPSYWALTELWINIYRFIWQWFKHTQINKALEIVEISLIYLSATAIVESVKFPFVRSFFISDSLLSMSISSPRAGSEVAVISITFDFLLISWANEVSSVVPSITINYITILLTRLNDNNVDNFHNSSKYLMNVHFTN